jgi:glyoxylase-like metal-dependent hydrolase (beta-lactamase superfamily II)
MATSNYTIQVLQTGHIELRGACIYYMTDFDRWEPFIYTMLVVRGNGETVVINSGVDDNPSFLDPFWKDWPGEQNLVISPEEKTAAALTQAGVKPEEVTHLIPTPLVYYATGNVDPFTNAEISLLKRGWLDFHAPKNRAADASRKTAISDRVLTHLVTTAWPRVRLLEDEDQVLPGIDVWFAGVHHRSSMAARIQTARGPVIYSDCCFKYRNLEENIPQRGKPRRSLEQLRAHPERSGDPIASL